MTGTVDTTVLPGLLTALRLPGIARHRRHCVTVADREGWPAARPPGTLLEPEVAEPAQRRIQRHQAESGPAPGKTFATFGFTAATGLRKAHVPDCVRLDRTQSSIPGAYRPLAYLRQSVPAQRGNALALASGGHWIRTGATIPASGPSGTGKSHIAAALGSAPADNGCRVPFTRTTGTVQRLQAARRDLGLAATPDKLDKPDLIVLDDLSHARKDRAETSVLLGLTSHRYGRHSLTITANQPFSAWDQVFPDPAMTVAAIDRPVHHASILEISGTSHRRRAALQRAAGPVPAVDPHGPTVIDAPRQPLEEHAMPEVDPVFGTGGLIGRWLAPSC